MHGRLPLDRKLKMASTGNDNHDHDDEERVDLPSAIVLESEDVVLFNHLPNRPRNSSQ